MFSSNKITKRWWRFVQSLLCLSHGIRLTHVTWPKITDLQGHFMASNKIHLPTGLGLESLESSQVVGDGFVSPRIGWVIFVPTQWWTQVPGDKEIPWWIHGTGGAYTVYAYIWWTKNLWFSCRYIYRTSPMDLVRKKLETLLQKTPGGQWQMKVYDGFKQGFWWWLASFVNGRM